MIKMNVETNSVTLYVCRNANSEISFLCNKPPVWAVQISIYPFQSDFTITTDTTRIILHPCVINGFMFRAGVSPSFNFRDKYGLHKTPLLYPYLSFGYTFK